MGCNPQAGREAIEDCHKNIPFINLIYIYIYKFGNPSLLYRQPKSHRVSKTYNFQLICIVAGLVQKQFFHITVRNNQ